MSAGTTTRKEHLDWAQRRALAYLPGDVPNAVASFISDLGKHESTSDHVVLQLIAMHAMGGLLDAHHARNLIEGTR